MAGNGRVNRKSRLESMSFLRPRLSVGLRSPRLRMTSGPESVPATGTEVFVEPGSEVWRPIRQSQIAGLFATVGFPLYHCRRLRMRNRRLRVMKFTDGGMGPRAISTLHRDSAYNPIAKRGEGVRIILERRPALSGRLPEYRLIDGEERLWATPAATASGETAQSGRLLNFRPDMRPTRGSVLRFPATGPVRKARVRACPTAGGFLG